MPTFSLEFPFPLMTFSRRVLVLLSWWIRQAAGAFQYLYGLRFTVTTMAFFSSFKHPIDHTIQQHINMTCTLHTWYNLVSSKSMHNIFDTRDANFLCCCSVGFEAKLIRQGGVFKPRVGKSRVHSPRLRRAELSRHVHVQ